jgi:hypothetical protein
MLPPSYRDSVKVRDVEMLEKLLKDEIPFTAVNETLSVREEISTFGWYSLIPGSRSAIDVGHANMYRLKHMVNELVKLPQRTVAQERTLRRAKWMHRFQQASVFANTNTRKAIRIAPFAFATVYGLRASGFLLTEDSNGDAAQFVLERTDGSYIFVWL